MGKAEAETEDWFFSQVCTTWGSTNSEYLEFWVTRTGQQPLACMPEHGTQNHFAWRITAGRAPATSHGAWAACGGQQGGCKQLQWVPAHPWPRSSPVADACMPQGGWQGKSQACTDTTRIRPPTAPPPSTLACQQHTNWSVGFFATVQKHYQPLN